MPKTIALALALLLSTPASVYAQRTVGTTFGEGVERQLPSDEPLSEWVHDPDLLESDGGDRIETVETVTEALETVKLTNVVPPIHFESGVANIPESTVEELRAILEGMRERRNVRLHLVGHADNQPLSESLAEIFGDNAGLSRERAGEVAELFQTSLGLPPEAISYEWAGDTRPIATNSTPEGRALNRRVEVEVWYDKVADQASEQEVVVEQDVRRIKVCRVETVCKLRYVEGQERRARVQNLLAPLHYGPESIDVPDDFIEQVERALANLSDKQNVVVKFVGYTDNVTLTGRTARIYGTHLGLSRARARRVALAVQDALGLPTAALDSDGRGSARPLGSNETARGRALNRRVEVEFWYDDPLQELPDEPQICPSEAGTEKVTRVYDPPWGTLDTINIVDGQPQIPPGFAELVRHAMDDVEGRMNVRVRFVGFTSNNRLDRRTALVYGDDIGLSAARARRTMDIVADELALDASQVEYEGRGYVHSDDVVNTGFTQDQDSNVLVQVVYDEYAPLDDYDGIDIQQLTREVSPSNPFGLNLMRITVDGKPIDDPNRSSADIQRCTDVALDNADIQFGFDNLQSNPRLSVSAQPTSVTMIASSADGSPQPVVRFKMYANYLYYIERSEIRLFEHDQSVEAEPLAVLEVGADGLAEWQPEASDFRSPLRELKYVLRAYGHDGNFDETSTQPLWLVTQPLPADEAEAPGAPEAPVGRGAAGGPDVASGAETAATAVAADGAEAAATPDTDRRLLAAYGESSLATQNIGLGSGTVTVRGSGIPPEHSVWVAGNPVPIDSQGNFVAETILPTGLHTVEVAVLDSQGNGELYLRDLEFKQKDWFYVGMADLTLSQNTTNGPMDLLQGENSPFDPLSSADGRVAFYVNGKFGEHWGLTASADTREGPIDELFSNFLDKSPDSLFRRIDPDYHYPTFGDDAVVEETAPTLGKFFVKLDQGDNYGLWGNFNVGYMNNELAQVDRGLYGGDFHYESDETTSFGEQRFAVDAFVAEPGTIPSREEFRGTGGSLYYLRRQDILTGSERVRIELRDKASGIVTGVLNLTPEIDYDIDYLQGRILLSEPLNSTADDNLLVRSGSIQGDEAYLVVRYEYTPGFEELDALSTGGQVHYWIGERVKLGVTTNSNEQDGVDSALNAADLTVRFSSDSWVKLQGASSEGLIAGALRSDDGGFGFYGYDDTSFSNADAGASRADVSVGLGDFLDHGKGRVTLYTQSLDAGYSAPGLATLTDTKNYGGTFTMPVTDKFSMTAKSDRRIQEQGLETSADEIDISYELNNGWDVSAGFRRDSRIDDSPLVPLTQEQGERTDAVVQVGYDSSGRWSGYGFLQDTLSVTGDRLENGRIGVGGRYQISERLGIDAEISNGDLGMGGKLGTNYIHSERTSMYLNYALENERTDNGLRANRGSEGNLTAGVKTRLSDSTSVFLEERYQNNATMTGLTHATGISLTPTERLNLGANTDIGTLRDTQTGAATERRAAGVQIGYGFDLAQFSSGLEYRSDQSEQPDTAVTTRKTWLFRNSFKYQMTPSGRLLGKLNFSDSQSSLGQFYDGGYTEAVLGYGYRPVDNDRLNALVKYTYFYNVPTTDQLTLRQTAAEFIQKSRIASVDVTYDLTTRWSIGGKYANRVGEVALDRENPEFFDNAASLYVLRADFRFKENWEGLIETRLLDMPDLQDRRSGALISVSRYLGTHVKVGAGYNFTDFSDDLTDLSFDNHGVFISLTGAM